jgi:hypothetical protein
LWQASRKAILRVLKYLGAELKKSLLLCLALCANASWAAAIADSTPDYTASEYLDLGSADAGTILDGSDFLSFGDAPGAFLVTANTDFDFTGDQQLLFLEMDSPPVAGLSAKTESDEATTPEPGTLPLFAAGLMAIGWVVRRRKTISPL